ncbi:MAG: hypothetical protein GX556_01520, partial [Fibrobacter sp.]|nr:hypothetical protein [Fibrobacter sp.]
MRLITTLLLSTAVLFSSYAEEKISNYHLAAGVSAGGSYSDIEADKLMERYFSPTDGIIRRKSPSFGVNVDFYAGRFAAVSSGLLYLKLGQSTKKAIVYFQDSPFEHELSTSSLIDYVGVPIILKGGINL